MLAEGPSETPDPYVPDPTKYRWLLLGAPGHARMAGSEVTAAALARISLPAAFVTQVNSILKPGATVLVTPESLSPRTSEATVQVLDADPPEGGSASKL